MNQEVNEYARLKSQLASAKSLIRSMGDGTAKKDWGLKAIAAGLEAYMEAIGNTPQLPENTSQTETTQLSKEELLEGLKYYYPDCDDPLKKALSEGSEVIRAKAKIGLTMKKN